MFSPIDVSSLPQSSMNLPPDKARLLRQYDNEKKWDLICDQVQGSGQGQEVGVYLGLDKSAG